VRRREIWRYKPAAERPGQSNLRLIVSANVINDADELPVVLAVHLVDTDPDSLLAIRVGDHGWARVLSIEPVFRRRMVERLGVADADTMDAVNAALRAAQDL
jgi:mRNA-degrading endonuclease toxin of MazEF toxin-antitoxin module